MIKDAAIVTAVILGHSVIVLLLFVCFSVVVVAVYVAYREFINMISDPVMSESEKRRYIESRRFYRELRARGIKFSRSTVVPSESIADSLANDGQDTCVVCFYNEPTCAALPCGHRRFCAECSRLLKDTIRCPICRRVVIEFKYMTGHN